LYTSSADNNAWPFEDSPIIDANSPDLSAFPKLFFFHHQYSLLNDKTLKDCSKRVLFYEQRFC